MKAIIFGINGQDGHYLNALLKKNKIQVIGVSRTNPEWLLGNVGNYVFVEQLIKNHKPNYIFHFAANSTTKHEALWDNQEAIEQGALNILESVKLYSPSTKVFLSGSAVQFVNQGVPINEHTPFASLSPYAVSRIYSVYMARYYKDKFGIKVYVGYFFNHDSPLRTERHVNQKIVMAVKRIAAGSIEKIEIGNVNVRKEFNYAGDMIDAVWAFINQESLFEIVIGTGKAYSIENWLECCFKHINKSWQDYVIINESFVPEYNLLVSNPTLLKSIGWGPKLSIEDLSRLMLS
jgi:GDPmannose 4,6-dehydratase